MAGIPETLWKGAGHLTSGYPGCDKGLMLVRGCRVGISKYCHKRAVQLLFESETEATEMCSPPPHVALVHQHVERNMHRFDETVLYACRSQSGRSQHHRRRWG